LTLIDFDQKGMPAHVAERINDLGGVWPALVRVIPALADTSRVLRPSSSAGLQDAQTGARLPGSGGVHVFVGIRDGADAERFLKVLHARCWLAGLGWSMVGAGGQLLDRSIVDRVVGTSERLVFEGKPVLVPPIGQDEVSRRPLVEEGDLLETVAACPPLTLFEQANLRKLHAKEAARLKPDLEKAKAQFIERQAKALVARGIASVQARHAGARQCEGVLLPNVELPFNEPALRGKTVADVLADPERFDGETLADPLEGVEYGIGKAKILRRSDGTPWIHSFAHGRTIYELKVDFDTAIALMKATSPDRAGKLFVQLVLGGDLGEDEIEQLRDLASRIADVGKRSLDQRLKRVRQEQKVACAREESSARLAERRDPRLQVDAPTPEAPWLPQMQLLNDVLSRVASDEPPSRDDSGYLVEVRARTPLGLHTHRAAEANGDDEPAETRLPAPEQVLLNRLEEPEAAELIERHIDYVRDGVSVHLAPAFVRHFIKRGDNVLPVVSSAVTLPIVLPNGALLSGPGLVRKFGTIFRVPPKLRALLPTPVECTPGAVARAMQYLTDYWLCDVTADYSGKCVLIECALSIIERILLDERPGIIVRAGQRGCGKTTILHMIAMATLGHRAAAAAWSPNAEERRKAMFSYLMQGVPFLVWDNLPRGLGINCATLEKILTTETYTDRVLGETNSPVVPAYTIQAITGNNVSARGDLASRMLNAELSVDRPDPENREFKHPDPIGWTQSHRGKILRAFYEILLGNPRRRKGNHKPPETRFKAWWELVGSAVEHAAIQHAEHAKWFAADAFPQCPAEEVSFKQLFLDGEDEDEQSEALATVLRTLHGLHGERKTTVNSIYRLIQEDTEVARTLVEALGDAASSPIVAGAVGPKSIAWRLKAIQNMPIKVDGELMVLRYASDKRHGAAVRVENARKRAA
jgi:hypothetical protein